MLKTLQSELSCVRKAGPGRPRLSSSGSGLA